LPKNLLLDVYTSIEKYTMTHATTPLAHNQTLYSRAELRLPSPWPLQYGGQIDQGRIAYTYYGDPSLPCILVLGGISAGRDVAHCTKEYASGWWQHQVKRRGAIDFAEFSVLGIDYLGGNGQSSAPWSVTDPRQTLSTQPIHKRLAIDTRDQARAIVYLADQLGIDAFYSAIGSSYGGMVTLALLEEFPQRVQKALVISCAHHTSPQSTGLRSIQRDIVQLGLEHNCAEQALALARALAMVTYRSCEELSHRFAGSAHIGEEGLDAPIVRYLRARGSAFAQAFNPQAFYCLSQSIDLHQIDPSKIISPITCVGVIEDQLIPIDLIQQMATLANAEFIKIHSIYGHDAFLKEHETIGWIIRKHLSPGG
jgi:homoserine O-acetyltransferase